MLLVQLGTDNTHDVWKFCEIGLAPVARLNLGKFLVLLLTRPYEDQLNFAGGPRRPNKRHRLSVGCSNKWIHNLKHIFRDAQPTQ